MEYDLLIVGNGFDIASGYWTTCRDFLNCFDKKGVYSPLGDFFITAYGKDFVINDEWNGFENQLCQYLEFLQYLFDDNGNVEGHFADERFEGVTGSYRFQIHNISSLPNNIFSILCLSNPLERSLLLSTDKNLSSDFSGIQSFKFAPEDIYGFVPYVANPATLSKKYVLSFLLDKLEKEWNRLENQLQHFIKEATKGPTSGPPALKNHTAKRVLSFNYSDTAERLYGLPSENVAHVHGDVSSRVVVGIEPSMITNQSVTEESAFIKFFKRFRRIYKNCNKDYNRKIMNNLTEESIIAIYGHSLDLSDRSILKSFFEKKLQRYDIYCYKDTDAYKIKLARLIGLDLYDELEKDGKINLICVK